MPPAWSILPTSAEIQIAVSNETASRFLQGRPPPWLTRGVLATSRSGKEDGESRAADQPNPPENLVPPGPRLAEVTQQTSPPFLNGERVPDAVAVDHQEHTISIATSDVDVVLPSPAPSDDSDENEQPSAHRQLETVRCPDPGEHQPDTSLRPTELNSTLRDAQPTTAIQENVSGVLQTAFPEGSGSAGLRLDLPSNARPVVLSQHDTRTGLEDERPNSPPTKRQCTDTSRSFGPIVAAKAASMTKSDRAMRLKARFNRFDCPENSSLTSLERDRYVFLLSAVQGNDVFYYQLHQVFCRWSIDPPTAFRALGTADGIDAGFRRLSKVLSDNSQISVTHLNWFSSFPDNLTNKPILAQVSRFLRRLGAKWDSMLQEVKERGYPTLISEVAQQLDAPSATLQSLTFLFTMKIHVPTSVTMAAANAIDELYRLHNQDRKHQTALPEIRPDMDSQIAQAFKDCLSRYKAGGQAPTRGQARPAGSVSGGVRRTSSPLVSQVATPSVAPSPDNVTRHGGPRDGSISSFQYNEVPNDHSAAQMRWQAALAHPATAVFSSVPPHRSGSNSTVGPPSYAGQQSPQLPGGIHDQQIQQPAGIDCAWLPARADSGVAVHSRLAAPSAPLNPPMVTPSPQIFSPAVAQTPQYNFSTVTPAPQSNSSMVSEALQMNTQQYLSPMPGSTGYLAQPSYQPLPNAGHIPASSLSDYGSQQMHGAFAQQQPPILHPSLPMSIVGDRTMSGDGTISWHPLPGQQLFGGNIASTAPFHQVSSHQQNSRQSSQFSFDQNVGSNQIWPAGDWQHQRQQITPTSVPDYRTSQNRMAPPPSIMGAQRSRRVMPTISHADSRQSRPVGRAGHLVREPGYRIDGTRYQNDPYNRQAIRHSLHQAYLRSPRRIPRVGGSFERYYQSIKCLAIGPKQVQPSSRMFTLTFDVSPSDFSKIPEHGLLKSGRPYCEYFSGSLRYRMRLCKFPSNVQSVSEKDWVTAATFWDPNLWLRFNSNTLTLRRKALHGKDLPIDLTSGVVEGQNVLEAVVSWSNIFSEEAMTTCMLFMAIEVVETLQHSKIMEMVQSREYEPEVTKQIIAGRLGSTLGDDEIMVVTEDFSISIADPYSSKMFDVPVRGINCTHLDCFDLENWLITRPRKPECPHGTSLAKNCTSCSLFGHQGEEPTVVDGWACPICGGDARPSQLRVDGFLVEVREQLFWKGKKAKKSIKVFTDGSWRALPEDEDNDIDEQTAETPSPTKQGQRKAHAPTPSRTQEAKHARLPAQIPRDAVYIQLD